MSEEVEEQLGNIYEEVRRLREAFVDNLSRFVQLIPAEGWRAWHLEDDGEVWWHPVVAWGLRLDGLVVALYTSGDGFAKELHSADVPIIVTGPGEERPSDDDLRARADEIKEAKEAAGT